MRSRVTPFTRDDSGPIVGPGFVTDHAIIVAFSFFFLFIFSPFAFRPRVFRGGKGEREGNAETWPERGWNMRCGQTDLFKGADQTSGLSNYALRAPVDGVVDKNSEMGR